MPEQNIRGNTLRAYVFITKNGPSELREVQRGLGLSTPSLASYHLGRLVEYGYAKQDELGRYAVVPGATGEILAGYSKVGAAVVPQLFFFAVMFTILGAFFSYEAISSSAYTPYLAATAAGMVVVIWYETARMWKKLVA